PPPRTAGRSRFLARHPTLHQNILWQVGRDRGFSTSDGTSDRQKARRLFRQVGVHDSTMNKQTMKLKFFATPSDFRKLLEKHHQSIRELWVGFYKKTSGKPSITWPESVDEALCFGWIDGLRKSVDEISYTIRFSPRRPRSIWSAVNIKRAKEL